jgi:hypothetical protein
VESYTSSVTDALRLFDALAAVARVRGPALVPNAAAYAAVRARALAWLLAVPPAANTWQGIWEDVNVWPTPGDDPSCHTALDAAAYVMDAADAGEPIPGVDALSFARRVVDWVVDTFVFAYATPREPAVQWGAYAVSEQYYDRNKMAFHTLHWVGIAARLANVTKNSTLTELATRSFNWCTYVLQDDNQTLIGPVDQSNWISCGLRLPRYAFDALAAIPAWGAPGEDHIVKSSGLVIAAVFSRADIRYSTFDPRSTEWLQLGACVPRSVTAGGVPLTGGAEGWWTLGQYGALTVFKANATEVVVACA